MSIVYKKVYVGDLGAKVGKDIKDTDFNELFKPYTKEGWECCAIDTHFVLFKRDEAYRKKAGFTEKETQIIGVHILTS